MKRLSSGLFACVVLFAQTAFAQTPAELAKTSRYVESFQNTDGGFTGKLGGTSTLGTTSSAIRILKNTGGSIPDVLASINRLGWVCGTRGRVVSPGLMNGLAGIGFGLLRLAAPRVPSVLSLD